VGVGLGVSGGSGGGEVGGRHFMTKKLTFLGSPIGEFTVNFASISGSIPKTDVPILNILYLCFFFPEQDTVP
jgi:hypothetical protein